METDGPQTEQSVSQDGSVTINIEMHPHQVSLLEVNSDSVVTGIGTNNIESPHNFTLSQNYPNPFNPSTKIQYTLPKNTFVKLIIYDVLGNVVGTLVNKEQPLGSYTVTFNANNIASGIYFYQLKTSSKIITRKMVVMK